MMVKFAVDGDEYEFDAGRPLDISIPLRFDGVDQPTVFGARHASMRPYADGDFIGSVEQGGSVNCEMAVIIPHCHGTHTECVGHIAWDRICVTEILKDAFIPATVITVETETMDGTHETYDPPLQKGDKIITRRALERAIGRADSGFMAALVIRTMPNGPEKTARNYDRENPAFFTRQGMDYIAGFGIRHLLVDMPSVDRLADEGRLTNHHIFWRVEEGSHDIDPAQASAKTITEMIYVPDTVPDGPYILNLQIAPFMADAAPSRPFLFKVKK